MDSDTRGRALLAQNVEWLRDWATGRGWTNSERQDRKSLNFSECTLTRNMDVNSSAEEVTEQTEKHVIGNWKLEGRESFLNTDRKLSGIVSCSRVKHGIYKNK